MKPRFSTAGEEKFPLIWPTYSVAGVPDMFIGVCLCLCVSHIHVHIYHAIHVCFSGLVCVIFPVCVGGISTHSLDHKRSAGGFIHGFRYTGD